jgi:hypothetical protein
LMDGFPSFKFSFTGFFLLFNTFVPRKWHVGRGSHTKLKAKRLLLSNSSLFT